MTDLFDSQPLFITQLLTLWAVLDPVSHLPLFMAATQALQRPERQRAALMAIVFAWLVLCAFGLVGQYLLHAMGVSLLSFQISGGIILFLFALSMVLGDHTPQQDRKRQDDIVAVSRKEMILSVAVYPLAVPIIAGPGSMLSMVVLIDKHRFSLAAQITTLVALAVALAALLVIFLAGNTIERVIGNAGIQLVRRIMGLILAALAINMVLNAVAIWLKLPPI
jgi:multiple antibiotic resistance protein